MPTSPNTCGDTRVTHALVTPSTVSEPPPVARCGSESYAPLRPGRTLGVLINDMHMNMTAGERRWSEGSQTKPCRRRALARRVSSGHARGI